MTYRNNQTAASQLILDAFTGLLIGGIAGPFVGGAVAAVAGILYLLSWLTIVGVVIGYPILMAAIPHGFWAAWAACAAGGLVGGYRSSRLCTDASSRDNVPGLASGIPIALLIMIVRIAGTHDRAWNKPLPYAIALIVALVAGALGGIAGVSLSSSLNRRRRR